MRVTDRMLYDTAAAHAGRARDRMEQASQEVASGARFEHPGDDPVSAGMLVPQRLGEARYSAILASTRRANDEISSADDALAGLSELFSRARELAVQFANATYNSEQRSVGSNEVAKLYQQAIALLNTRVENRYVFGGNLDAAPPFDSAGNYLGDTAVRQVEIAPGVLQDASVRADVLAKGVGGGTDALAALQSLAAALSTNDIAGIQAALDPLDSSIGQVAHARTQAGAIESVLEAASTAAQAARDAEKARASREVDTDAIDASSRLALAQRALDASLTAASESFRLTLLNKLG
jgi:flagellar hook-associated protein 3 FlgL